MGPVEINEMTVVQPTVAKKKGAQEVLETLELKADSMVKKITKMDLEDPEWDLYWVTYQSVVERIGFVKAIYM